MPKLIFVGPQGDGRVYEFLVEKTTVGRDDHNMLIIRDNSVSHSHCEILVNGPEVIVRDLGSVNGTFVDGVRVAHQCQVKSGHIIRFGSVDARLELEPPTNTGEDTATGLTAIRALTKAQIDQQRERDRAQSHELIMEIPGPGSADHTTIVTPQPPSAAAGAASKPPVSPPPSSLSRTTLLVILAAVALVLVVAAALILWLVLW